MLGSSAGAALMLALLQVVLALGSSAHATHTLRNAAVTATFSDSRLVSVGDVAVTGDDFVLELVQAGSDAATVLASAAATAAPTVQPGANATAIAFRWSFAGFTVEARYRLVSNHAEGVEKQLRLLPPTEDEHDGGWSHRAPTTFNVTRIAVINSTSLVRSGGAPVSSLVASSHYGLGAYAVFHRFDESHGAYLTCQNPYLSADVDGSSATLSYAPLMLTPNDGSFEIDACIIGQTNLTGEVLPKPADPLDVGEQRAIVACLRDYLVVPPSPNATVKINIAWTENDFQLDIADLGNRTIYKRIIDRAADFGITHILFAPRNSDVSDRGNNTDAWGWEQILWFGMGQRLRLGLWEPGDPLPESLIEMLTYMKSKAVKPVAYVYPILAFLAGTVGCPKGEGRCDSGTNPPWIVNGSYDLLDRSSAGRPPLSLRGEDSTKNEVGLGLGNGPMRASLAAPSLQKWLPDTMLAFAEQTGAGGFGFDYTYFEQNADNPSTPASQYAQWTGWRKILSRLHTAKGGKACGGGPYGAGTSSCVVDNRQQNHAWGPWMWVQGGTYAEPLMSDEQPGSWMFYEADLHTDRLSANEERSVAWNYRNLELCPAEVLPGFAMHQTDRDPTVLQHDQRSNNHSRARDYDLLGSRYSILSSVGTAGLNNVLNMLPARDEQEFSLLPQEDIEFVKGWMNWTDSHVSWLRNTRTITGQPSGGKLDATAMISGSQGALFVQNPTARQEVITITLNATLGFDSACSGASQLAMRASGSSNRGFVPHDYSVVACGGTLNITVPPSTALVFELGPHGISHDNAAAASQELPGPSGSPRVRVFGNGAATATLDWTTGTVRLTETHGPAGERAELMVVVPMQALQVAHLQQVIVESNPPVPVAVVPAEATALMTAAVDVHTICKQAGYGDGRCAVATVPNETTPATEAANLNVHLHLPLAVWSGPAFQTEIGSTARFAGGQWSGSFSVPQAAMNQLSMRNKSYPIVYDLDPDGNNDANVRLAVLYSVPVICCTLSNFVA